MSDQNTFNINQVRLNKFNINFYLQKLSKKLSHASDQNYFNINLVRSK